MGEVALQPSTGGVFTVEIFYLPASPAGQSDEVKVQSKILWDRKTEGGFPGTLILNFRYTSNTSTEVKELKRRVRDVIDPNRGLGHVDGNKKPVTNNAPAPAPATVTSPSHIKSEEAAQEHSRRNLEEQPGGRRHSVPDSVAAAAATSIPAGEVCDLRKRNPDGSICEDCL